MRQLKIQQSVTTRTEALDMYMRDINSLPMVTVEEETELAYKIQNGDEKAFKRLVEANLRFVISVAKQYQRANVELTDLINEGNLGLMKAARRFDPSRGFKFISFAVWWIRQSIMEALSSQERMIRLPQNQVCALNKLRKASDAFMQEKGREPTDAELAEITEMEDSKVTDSLSCVNGPVSLDKPLGDESDSTLLDLVGDNEYNADSITDSESRRTDIEQALMMLNVRERDVVKSFYGIGCREMTLEEIGEKYDLSRERARQLKEKAIRKLAKSRYCGRLRQYL